MVFRLELRNEITEWFFVFRFVSNRMSHSVRKSKKITISLRIFCKKWFGTVRAWKWFGTCMNVHDRVDGFEHENGSKRAWTFTMGLIDSSVKNGASGLLFGAPGHHSVRIGARGDSSSLWTMPILDDDVVRMWPSDMIGWDNRGTKGVRLAQTILREPVSD